MNKPNFFIVGFGRSGSTSLYKYLRQHPEVYMSPVKEPKYFCPEMLEGSGTDAVRTLADYLALFEPAENEPVLGEASTMYILSDEAAQRIHEFNPASKIVILLRHPVDFLQSWHALGVRDGYEPEPDLMRALELEERRTRQGGARQGGAEISYRYRHVIHRSPELVRRWYERFGVEQVKPILFDDLSGDTESTYRDLLGFLGVDQASVPDFRVHNQAKSFGKSRVGWLDKLLRTGAGSSLRRLVPAPLQRLRRRLLQMNTTQVRREPLAQETRRALVDEFTPVIKELEQIVQRDLSAWYAAGAR